MTDKLFFRLVIVITAICCAYGVAQTNPATGTVVNSYASVSNISGVTVSVDSTVGFSANDRALLIQMKDGVANRVDTPASGDILSYGVAGRFEFVDVASVGAGTVTLQTAPTINFNTSGIVQLIQVPVYTNQTLTGTLSAAPWDGAKGGVLAIDATGTLTLSGTLDVTGLGFRGGAVATLIPYNFCASDQFNYTGPVQPGTGNKGEGIVTDNVNHLARRGHNANGGGGGNITDAGGGGGGNYGAGGLGGRELFLCDSNPENFGGLGGQALDYSPMNRVFLGGGGGSGSEVDSTSPAFGGARTGGGIVILRASEVVGAGGQFIANGLDAPDDDFNGADGGGAGGSIFITSGVDLSGNLTVSATGGDGGDEHNTSFPHGTGGGGGGGAVLLNGAQCSSITNISLDGGLAGFSDLGSTGSSPTWGATDGVVGACLENFNPPSSDYSDAPVVGTSYGEASHTITSGVRLGAAIDADNGFIANADASGDGADDDGVTLPTLIRGQSTSITVDVSQVAIGDTYLQAWIDWNGDGDFADTGEQIADDLTLPVAAGTSGTISFTVNVPLTATTSQTFARFRWSGTVNLDSTAPANDGEVEDYALVVVPSGVCSAVGLSNFTFNTPSITGSNIGMQALYSSVGTVNGSAADIRMTVLDMQVLDGSGNPYSAADMSGLVEFSDDSGRLRIRLQDDPPIQSPYTKRTARVRLELLESGTNTPVAGDFSLTISDFDDRAAQGEDLIERLLIGTSLFDSYSTNSPSTVDIESLSGQLRFSGTVNEASTDPESMARLYLRNQSTIEFTLVVDGDEISSRNFDFDGTLSPPFPSENCNPTPVIQQDYGDAPTNGSTAPDGSSTTAYGEATHDITNSLRLGATIDADGGSLASANADGDDNNGSDDEDGVTLPNLTQSQTATIPVSVTQANANDGYLQAWIDWNGDGDFADTGEQVADDLTLASGTSGTISVPVVVPIAATTSQTYARFRWSTTSGLGANGSAPDGEVEDYAVTILLGQDYSDAPTSGTAPNGTDTNAYGEATHTVTSGINLGTTIDTDAGSIANADASGDGGDDDGFSQPTLTAGAAYTLQVQTTDSGTLYGWIDYDGDGSFDVDDSVTGADGIASTGGTVNLPIHIPADAVTNPFMRLRYSTDAAAANPSGAASDGEVEDYRLTIGAKITNPPNPGTPVSFPPVCTVYNATGADQAVTVPAGAIGLGLKLWGAGGGHEIVGGGYSGAGGYTEAEFDTTVITPGDTLTLVVGEGGNINGGPGELVPAAVYGFGSFSSHDQGGGLTGLFTGAGAVLETDQARALAVAGGGGGFEHSGGSRTGTQGGNGNSASSGGQPTMRGSTDLSPNRNNFTSRAHRSGGGGGYYGGGRVPAALGNPYSGVYQNFQAKTAAASGGSGFVSAQAVAGQILSTPDGTITPPQTSDTDYVAGVGRGSTSGSAGQRAGGDGLAVLCWNIATDRSDAPTSGTAPNGTDTNAYGVATHTVVSGIGLGAAIDADAGSIANADASGDGADDDGVTFPTLTQEQSATIPVSVTQANANDGYLQAWIDFNGDGDFADVNEQVATNLQTATTGTSTLNVPVTVPATATTSQTFARFRWSSTQGLDSTAAAGDGEVEDYALTISEMASLELTKVTVPATDTGLFDLSISNSTPAVVGSATAVGNGGTTGEVSLLAGSYSVAELANAGSPTALSDYVTTLVCTDDDTSTELVSTSATLGSVTLAAGQSVTCVLTNTRNSSITIIKDASPDDAADFAFTTTGTGLSDFSLDDDADAALSNTRTFSGLAAGSYSVSETLTTNWDLTDITCTGATNSAVTHGGDATFEAGDTDAAITLAAGEDITCTFTNTQKASLELTKVTVPATDTGTFDLSISDRTPSLVGSASNVGDGGTTGEVFVVAGTYSVAEVANAGSSAALSDYFTTLICTDDDTSTELVNSSGASGSVTLAAGQNATCVLTNTRKSSITVVKDASPDDEADFAFTTTGTGLSGFSLDDDADATLSNSQTFSGLAAGTYGVTETLTTNWDLTNISCAGAATSTVSHGGDASFDAGDTDASITLTAGEDIVCTFTNTFAPLADLSIIKTDSPDPVNAGETLSYTITVTNGGPYTLPNGEVMTVSDSLPTGFAATSYTPTGGTYDSVTGAFTLTSALATSGTVELVIAGTVDADYTGTSLSNTASVAPPTGVSDPNPPNNTTPPVLTTVNRVMDLEISKVATPSPAVAGAALSYTLTVSNSGPSELLTTDTFTVTDTLPAGFTATSYTPSAGTYDDATGEWTGVNLLADGSNSVTLTIAGTVSATTTSDIDNTATVAPPTAVTDPNPPNDSDTITTPVNQVADLSITKASSPDPYVPGSPITYTLTVGNAGPTTVTEISVTDNVPADIISPVFTPSTGSYDSTTDSWTGLNLAAGQSITLTIEGTVSPTKSGALNNTATVSPPSGVSDPDTSDNSADNTNPANRTADLSISKVDSVDPVVAGAALSYTITVSNNGPSSLNVTDSFKVVDSLPAGFSASSYTPSSGTYDSGTGVWTGVSLPGDGSSLTLTIAGTVDPDVTTTLSNSVTVTPPTDVVDPTPANDSDTEDTDVDREADLAISKVATPSPVRSGEALSYTLTVTNAGASDILTTDTFTVSDSLPADFTPTTYTPSAGTYNDASGEWTGVSLLADGSNNATLTIAGTVAATTSSDLDNTATVAPPTGVTDPNPPNDSDAITTPVIQEADLSIAKTDSPDPVIAGETLTYTITVTNGGPYTLASGEVLSVTDTLPAGFSATTYTPTGGTYDSATGAFTLSSALAVSGTVGLVIEGTVDADFTGTSLSNTASVTPPPSVTDPNPPNNTTPPVPTTVNRVMDLEIAKAASPSPAVAGAALSYTLTVSNNGPSGLVSTDTFTVADTLPADFTATTYTPSVGTYDDATGEWTGVNLSADGSNTVTLTIAGTLSATASGSISNTATITPPTGVTDPSPPNDSATVTTPITKEADLSVVKVSSPDPYVPGSAITYTLTVSSAGPSTVNEVTVTDNLPTAITAPVYTASTGTYDSATGSWTGLSLASGDSVTLTISGVVDAATTGALSNTATVAPPTGVTDTNPPNNSSTDTNSANRQADLGMSKLANPSPAVAGATLSYILTVTNDGPGDIFVSDSFTVVDTLPTGFTATGFTPSTGTYDDATGTWTGVSLPGDGSGLATLTITGSLSGSATGSLSNTATVAPPAGVGDPNPPNDSDTLTTPVTREADLSMQKVSSPNPYVPGAAITYTLTVANAGPSTLSSVIVTDNLPAEITSPTYTASTGSYDSATGDWTGLSLAAGDSITLTITGVVAGGTTGSLSNTATVAPPPGVTDSSPPNDSSTNINPTNRISDLGVSKTGSVDPVIAGNALSYTVTVTNYGPSSLNPSDSFTVADTLPAGFSASSYTPSAGSYDSATGDWTGVSLTGDGSSLTLTIAGTVDANVTASALSNTVTVSPPPGVVDDDNSGGPDSDTEDTAVERVTDLAIVKAASPDPAQAGQALNYTLTVTNNGPSDIVTTDSFTVVDNLPAEVTAGSYTPSAGTYDDTTGDWTGVSLPGNGASVTLTIVGTLASSADTDVTNSAVVAPPTGVSDPNQPDNSTSVTTPVARETDLAITKTDSPDPVLAGGTLSYTITVTNGGASSLATGEVLTITDTLPTGFSATTYTPTGGSYDSSTGAFTLGANLAPTGSVELVITGTVAADYTASTLSNVASVTPPPGVDDPESSNDSTPPVITTVNREADLSLSKTDSVDPVVAGEALSYTLTVENNGGATLISGEVLTISDSLPTGFTATSYTPTGGTYDSASGAFTLSSDLASGSSINLVIAGTVDASFTGPDLTNTATVTPPTGVSDPDSSNDSDTETTTVDKEADLSINKTSNPDPYVPGANLTYTITVSNAGPTTVTRVTVADNVPAEVQSPTYTASTGSFDSVTGLWSGLSLAAGDTVTLTISGTVNPAATGQINNTATVTPPADVTDPNQPNNSSTNVNPTGSRQADLSLVKTASVSPVVAGEALSYTLTVTNNGAVTLLNGEVLTIRDSLPTGFTANTYTPTGGSFDSVTGAFTLDANLAAGGTVSLDIDGTVAANYAGGPLNNTATVSPPPGVLDPDVSNDSDTETTPVTRVADLGVSKVDSADPIDSGDALSYTVTVVNNGPSSLLNGETLTLDDSLPIGFSAASYTPTGGSYDSVAAAFTLSADMASGDFVTLEIAGSVAGSFSGTLTNTVTVSPPPGVSDNDGSGGSNSATEPTTVNPVAVDDSASTKENTPVDIDLSDNDLGNIDPTTVTETTPPTNGSVSIDPVTGVATYTPDAGFTGVDTFEYEVCDTAGNCDTATVTVNVSDVLAAVNDTATTAFETPIGIDVKANDLPGDFPTDPTSVTVQTEPTNGSTNTDPATGVVTYTPNSGYSGTDSFGYEVCDTDGNCDTATVTITITPDAVNDTATTPAETSVAIDLPDNDLGDIDPTTVTEQTPPTNGAVTINQTTGEATYTPNPDFSGVDTFTYEVCDTAGNCDTATVTITVNPVATDDTATTSAETPFLINVSDNDIGDIDPTTVTETTPPTNGTLSIDPGTGETTYTPDSDFSGVDTFEYDICDTSGNCDTATVTVTVNPVATNDAVGTKENTPVDIDVTDNDIGDIDPTTVTETTPPTDGILIIDPVTGVATYTPDVGFSGVDTFEYEVCDFAGNCDTATVTVNVSDVIAAVDDTATTPAATPVDIDVKANDLPGDFPIDPTTVTELTPPTNGSVDIDPTTGVATYTPDADFSGTDTFEYEVCDTDSNCDVATVTITVTPDAADDSATTTAETPVTIDITDNDVGTIDPTTVTEVSPPTNGTLSIDPVTGEVTYTPDPDFSGIDTFEYEVCDSAANCDSATVTVTVNPVAADDTASTKEDTPVTINITDNDVGDIDPTTVTVETPPTNGTLSIDPVTGETTYTPNLGFSGVDTFEYEVCDSTGNCDTATVTVTISDVIVAVDDGVTTTVNTPTTLDVISNDVPGDSPIDPDSVRVTTQPINGTVSTGPGGTVTYTPNPGFSGSDTFEYEICDAAASCDTAVVTVTVTPLAENDAVSVPYETPTPVEILGNDEGILDPSSVTIVSQPSNGTVTVNPDGTLTYTPDPGFTGIDTLEYEVCDTAGNCDTATVTLSVPPIAVDDSATTTAETPVAIPVVDNDIAGPEPLDPTTVTVTTPPTNGTVSVDPVTGIATYTPNPGFTGTNTFDYEVCDTAGNCDTATVTVTVEEAEAPLIGIAKGASVAPNGDGSFDINFTFTVENFGNVVLDAVQITDSLADFYTNTDLEAGNISKVGGDLSYNASFNGSSDLNLLTGTDSLALGETKTLVILLADVSVTGTANLTNVAEAVADSPAGTTVTDDSTNGVDPDSDPGSNDNDNNGDPGDNSDPTPITLPPGGNPATIQLMLQKDVAPGPYTLGDSATYTLSVNNPDEQSSITVDLRDTIPVGTTYVTNSSTLTFSDSQGERSSATEPSEETKGVLTWSDLVLEPGATVTVVYKLRILANAESPLLNTVQASGSGGAGTAVAEATAEAEIELEDELLSPGSGTLIGRVYIDTNRDNRYSEGTDVPVRDARVILANGWQTRTDAQGNYAFRDVLADSPGESWSVQLDRATAPYRPRPHPDGLADGYVHRVRISGLSVSDFPLEPITGFTDAERETTLVYGPVRIEKRLVESADMTTVTIDVINDGAPISIIIIDPQPDGTLKEFSVNVTDQETIRYQLPPGSPLLDPSVRRGQ